LWARQLTQWQSLQEYRAREGRLRDYSGVVIAGAAIKSEGAMAIFFGKNFAKVFFKSDGAGQRVFYPYGRFGKGRIVSPVEEAEIEAYIRKQFSWWTGLILAQIVMQSVLGIGITLALLGIPFLILLIAFHSGLRRRTKGLPVSTVRMTGPDQVRNQAQHMSATRAYGLVAVGIIMTLGAGFTALHESGPNAWIGAFGVVFFGFCLVQLIRIVKARWTSI
jgi:hypothetical protein